MPDANGNLTLEDELMFNNQNLAEGVATKVLNRARAIRRMAATTATKGYQHEYLVDVEAPGVGFREPNHGLKNSAGTTKTVVEDLKLLSATFGVDRATADNYSRGRGAYFTQRSNKSIRQAFFVAERQAFYGTDNNADGYTGLADNGSLKYSDSSYVIDAGGTGNVTDAWLLRMGPEDMELIMGYDGNLEIGDEYPSMIQGVNGQELNGYVVPIEGWFGIKPGGIDSVVRIANLSTDAPFTDSLYNEAVGLMLDGGVPTMVVTSSQGVTQLWKSRQAAAYHPQGAEVPIPTSMGTTELIVTPSIRQNADPIGPNPN